MTVTVSQLIEALQKVPQEAIVECLQDNFNNGFAVWKDLSLDDLYVCDLRGNSFVKPDSPNYGKVFLKIGDK